MTLPAPMAKNVAMIVAHPLLYGEANGGVSCDAPLPVGPSVPRPDRHSLSRACSLVRSRRLTDNLRSMLCDPLAGGVSATVTTQSSNSRSPIRMCSETARYHLCDPRSPKPITGAAARRVSFARSANWLFTRMPGAPVSNCSCTSCSLILAESPMPRGWLARGAKTGSSLVSVSSVLLDRRQG